MQNQTCENRKETEVLLRKLEAVRKEKEEAMEQIENLEKKLRNQENDTSEQISHLREANDAERSRCEDLIKELQRLRNMPGRKC